MKNKFIYLFVFMFMLVGIGVILIFAVDTITLNHPTEGNHYSSSYVDFNITISDADGIGTCMYSLDNFATNYSMGNDTATHFYNTSLKKDLVMGTNIVNFTCNDTLGNINMSEGISFTMDCLTPYEDMIITEDTTFCPGTYYLNGSDTGAIDINANDITLDCNGATIIGNWSETGNNQYYGIYVNNQNNFTINNCTIKNFDRGLYLGFATNGTINNSNFTDNRMGIHISRFSQQSEITNNLFYNNSYSGIWFYNPALTNGLLISNNTFYDWGGGIGEESTLTKATNLTIYNNIFYQNTTTGGAITQHNGSNWIIDSNTIYGSNELFSRNIRIAGDNNIIKNNWMDKSQYNIWIATSGSSIPYNNSIINNTILNSDQGSSLGFVGGDLVYFLNNTIINMTNSNMDGYGVGLKVQG